MSVILDKEIVGMNIARNSIKTLAFLRANRETRIIKQRFTDVSELDKIEIEEGIINLFEVRDDSNSDLTIKWHNDDEMIVELEVKIVSKENIDSGDTIKIGEIVFL